MRLTEGTRRTETVRRKKRRRSSCAQRAKERLKNVLSGTGGMGVVEVILIIVVLIGLVIIFQTNIKGIVTAIFRTMQSNVGKIK